jgi:opacity protein-like surface antigen
MKWVAVVLILLTSAFSDEESLITLSGYKSFHLNYVKLLRGVAPPYWFEPEGIRRDECLSAKASGRLLGETNFHAQIYDSPYAPGFDEMFLEIFNQRQRVKLGSLTASFPGGGELLLKDNDLQGVEAETKFSQGSVYGVTSSFKSRRQYQEFKYKGQGVYKLSGAQDSFPELGFTKIVPYSERITINGELLKRDEDYEINYFLAEFTFTALFMSRVSERGIDEFSVIKVEYEIREEKVGARLYGINGYWQPKSFFQIGTSGLWIKPKQNLGKLSQPQEIYGINTRLTWDDENTLTAEYAFSQVGVKGEAYRLATINKLGEVSFEGFLEKANNKFVSIARPLLGGDFLNLSTSLVYTPFSFLKLTTEYQEEKYTYSSETRHRRELGIRTEITPEKWPGFSYQFQRRQERDSYFKFHELTLNQHFPYFSFQALYKRNKSKYGEEKLNQTFGLYFFTRELERLTGSVRGWWSYVVGEKVEYLLQNYFFELKYSPTSSYNFEVIGAFNEPEDGVTGWLTNLKFFVQPSQKLQAGGRYNRQWLKEGALPVAKEWADVRVIIQPRSEINLSYQPMFRRYTLLSVNRAYYLFQAQKAYLSTLLWQRIEAKSALYFEDFLRRDNEKARQLFGQTAKRVFSQTFNFFPFEGPKLQVNYEASFLRAQQPFLVTGFGYSEYKEKSGLSHILNLSVETVPKHNLVFTNILRYERIFQKGEGDEVTPGEEYNPYYFVDIDTVELRLGSRVTWRALENLKLSLGTSYGQRRDFLREKLIGTLYPEGKLEVKRGRGRLSLNSAWEKRLSEDYLKHILSLIVRLNLRADFNVYLNAEYTETSPSGYRILKASARGEIRF